MPDPVTANENGLARAPPHEPCPPTRAPRTTRAFERLARAQARHPWRFLGGAALVVATFGTLALGLELRTQFEQLLPQHEPSVVELRRLRARTALGSIISIVLEGEDTAVLRQASRATVDVLTRAHPPWLVDAADGIHAAREFLEPRAGLFVDEARLRQVRDDLTQAKARAVMRTSGLDLGLEDDPATFDRTALTALLDDPAVRRSSERYPGGYFQSADGRAVVVLLQTSIAPGDLVAAREALATTRALAGGALAAHPSVRAGYTGDLVTGIFEYGAVQADLAQVGLLGVGMVLGIVFLFFMRARVLVAMGCTITAGLALTFGVTRLAIGHLNIATAFLVSIVAGNGINAGIVYAARYLEARRAGAGAAAAVRVASTQTWLPTFGAAVAAAAAYGSLAFTSFLGLRHFALVGGAGMLLCWVATFGVAPPVLVLAERVRPVRHRARARRRLAELPRRAGRWLGDGWLGLLTRFPAGITCAGVIVTLASTWLAVRYVSHDQLEYDARRTQNDLGTSSELYRLSMMSKRILGANLDGSVVVLVDRLDQVIPLKRALETKRDAAPAQARPFDEVHTIQDLVPPDQERKLPLLREIASVVRSARARGLVTDADWAAVRPVLPPGDLRPFGLADLPVRVARPFTEKAGVRGTIVILEPTAGQDQDDLRYLLRFTSAFRSTALPSGERVQGSGRAMIFADMLQAMLRDMPVVLTASLLFTVVAVVATLRRWRLVGLVLASLLTGVAWLLAALDLLGVKLNFINFVALPVTFGIGVEYALNVVQRHSIDGIRSAIRRTGPAVVLCSLTTILSYLALLGSINQAIRSMGLVAVVGELCCLLAATVVLPAALIWHERRAGSPGADTVASVPDRRSSR